MNNIPPFSPVVLSRAQIATLAEQFYGPHVHAVALVGSYARGDAGPWSDVDVVRLADTAAPLPDDGAHLCEGKLVHVHTVAPAQIETWFTEPFAATQHIGGLRSAHALLDERGAWAALQARARAFVWDAAMQARADAEASTRMAGWAEEAHKGLEGLRRNDTGRILHACFGLSWGLSHVIQIQRGVLVSGNNAAFGEVEAALADARMAWLRRVAFGVGLPNAAPPSLREQVTAGLHLYMFLAEHFAHAWQPADAPVIQHTAAQIRAVMPLRERTVGG